MNSSIGRKNVFIGLLLASSFACFAQDEYNDGAGDTPEKPDIWVTPTDNGGAVITPGDGQPVTSSTEGNREVINYDQEPSPDSDVVITEDPQ
ncbi:hypothetical protein ACSZM9_09625 [Aeromonas hydrophila]|uniref:hypothetical protein n=1 Tax=Aeromonas hydrophila TaxID=644 RepID=UPI003EC7979F